MGILQGIRQTYSLFGYYGILLVTKARVLSRSFEVVVSVPQIEHPVHLRLRTSDVPLFSQIILNAEYDWNVVDPPRVIVDAGANIGLTSIFYANKYPEARILAIEPESSNFKMLKTNTACYPNVVPIRGALWSYDTTLCLSNASSGHWAFETRELPESDLNRDHELVPGITVDNLMANYHIDSIDILKVDIEGSEREVFQSSSTWIDKVKVIAVELHDSMRNGCSRSVYSAASNFEHKCHRNEITFFARGGSGAEVTAGVASKNRITARTKRASLRIRLA
jgi:FkbM family methyltransferase